MMPDIEKIDIEVFRNKVDLKITKVWDSSLGISTSDNNVQEMSISIPKHELTKFQEMIQKSIDRMNVPDILTLRIVG